MSNKVDIRENDIVQYDIQLLKTLLIDRSKPLGKEKYGNIIWATDINSSMGDGYGEQDEITIETISGEHGLVLKPRVAKTKEEQEYRVKDKAEVFTPSWICNRQNNLIDNAWFASENIFNTEIESGWKTNTQPISFPTTDGKSWQDYVKDVRLEVSCGEAPYLVSRYDTITGEPIPIQERIGLLDRTMRVVSENVENEETWLEWAQWAFKSIYGFDFQGDNLLLARENLLYTFIDYYEAKFSKIPSKDILRKVAVIISWNLWQMDGLKCVVPFSCHEDVSEEYDLWGESTKTVIQCEGCAKDEMHKHNGIYCKIKDWETGGVVKFLSLIKK